MFHSNKRVFAVVALAAGAALILAGCASGGDPPQAAATFDPEEEVTLDFAFWGNDIRADLYNEGSRPSRRSTRMSRSIQFLAWDPSTGRSAIPRPRARIFPTSSRWT